MNWINLALEFEALAVNGDANVEWTFDAGHGVRRQWLISDDENNIPHRDLWELFATAGRCLPREGAPRSVFPAKLLAEPSADWRWLAALRHINIHVVHTEPAQFRSECGMICAVAAASAKLCRRLAESERFPKVGPSTSMDSEDRHEPPPARSRSQEMAQSNRA